MKIKIKAATKKTFTLSEENMNKLPSDNLQAPEINDDLNNVNLTIEPIQLKQTISLSWDGVSVYGKRKFKLSLNCLKCNNKSNSSSSSSTSSKEDLCIEPSRISVISLPTSNTTTESSPSPSIRTLSKSDNMNQILDNVSGVLHSGQTLAILGPSGAGKTTLLNVLNSRISNNYKVYGSIRINGKKLTSDQLGTLIGYVQQDDVFIGTLSVYEHLKFLAMLKMSKDYSKSERLKRVEQVLEELNLTKCRNTKIGFVDKSGISGGEKRRLSFASEILTDPQILFCDEPTSGLDSHMAQTIVNTIKNLAQKGKIIISTIHQPSSQVYEKFDVICLLAHGRTAYYGSRLNAFRFFSNLGYVCPSQYNPADYFVEMMASKSDRNIQNIHAICDSYEKSEYYHKTLNEINELTKSVPENQRNRTNNKATKKYSSSVFKQFLWLLWRHNLVTIREPLAVRILFAQSIIIGLFLGFTYFQEKNTQAGIQNKGGIIFVMIMQHVLSYLFGSINAYFNMELVTRRDVKNRIYSVTIYYIAKTISDLPYNIIFPVITTSITFWLAGISTSGIVYLKTTAIFALTTNISVAFGSILAMLTPNVESATALIGPTVLPLLIFSGFLINNNSMPVYFFWLKYVSWMYYSFEAIMITLWSSIKSISCESDLAQNSTILLNQTPCLRDGDAVLSQLAMKKEDFDRDIGVLLAMVTALPIIAGILIILKYKFTN